MKIKIDGCKQFFKRAVSYVRTHKLVSLGIFSAALVLLIVGLFILLGGKKKEQTTTKDESIIAVMKQAKEKNPKLYEKMEIRDNGPCKNAFEVTMPDGSVQKDTPPLCSFYDDQVARLDDPIRVSQGLLQKPIECLGDGQSGRRVQGIYAYISGQENKLATYREKFGLYAERVNAIFNTASSKHGYGATVRWVTNADCSLNIATVVLPVGFSGFYEMVSAIYKQLGIRADRNYLVWVDASVGVCGLGTWIADTNPNPDANRTNQYPAFARADTACWGGTTEAHELLHNFGAVSTQAPNSNGGGHCTDGIDVMCYGASMRSVCPIDGNNYQLIDCQNDDYFHPNPPAGSFLANHWNTARNYALQITKNKDTTPPPAPSPVNLSRNGFNIYISWGASVDTGSGINHYRVYRLSTTKSTHTTDEFKFLTNTQNLTYNYFDYTANSSTTPYYNFIYIVAVDNEGNLSSPSQIARIDPPEKRPTDSIPAPSPPITIAPQTPPAPEAPKVPPTIINLRATNITESGLTLGWDYDGDDNQVKTIQIYLNGVLKDQFPKPYYGTRTIYGLSGGVYAVVVKLIDENNQTRASSPIEITTLNYKDPSILSNLKPYNLQVVSKDAQYYYVTATFNSTGGAAYKYTINANGSSTGPQHYLLVYNYPHTEDFRYGVSATVVTSFNISVYDRDDNLLIQSDSIPNPLQ